MNTELYKAPAFCTHIIYPCKMKSQHQDRLHEKGSLNPTLQGYCSSLQLGQGRRLKKFYGISSVETTHQPAQSNLGFIAGYDSIINQNSPLHKGYLAV